MSQMLQPQWTTLASMQLDPNLVVNGIVAAASALAGALAGAWIQSNATKRAAQDQIRADEALARRIAEREWRRSQVISFLDTANRRLNYHAEFLRNGPNEPFASGDDPALHPALTIVDSPGFQRAAKRFVDADNA